MIHKGILWKPIGSLNLRLRYLNLYLAFTTYLYIFLIIILFKVQYKCHKTLDICFLKNKFHTLY